MRRAESPGPAAARPRATAESPRRCRVASAGAATSTTSHSPSRCVKTRTATPGIGRARRTARRRDDAAPARRAARAACPRCRPGAPARRGASAGASRRCATAFGSTSATPTFNRSGRPVGRSFTVSTSSRPSAKISSAYWKTICPTSVGTRRRPCAAEELLVERALEGADLGAHRRLREAELVARLGHAAGLRGQPEVEEVVVVQPFHRRRPYFALSRRVSVKLSICSQSRPMP